MCLTLFLAGFQCTELRTEGARKSQVLVAAAGGLGGVAHQVSAHHAMDSALPCFSYRDLEAAPLRPRGHDAIWSAQMAPMARPRMTPEEEWQSDWDSRGWEGWREAWRDWGSRGWEGYQAASRSRQQRRWGPWQVDSWRQGSDDQEQRGEQHSASSSSGAWLRRA